MRRFLSFVVVFTAVGAVCAPAAAAANATLQPPTSAAVLDPFRLPDGPYAAGNRGIEYDTAVNMSIAAAGSGVVVFAGPVAGDLHITIDHGDGLLSSYSFIDSIGVSRGDQVGAGEPIAIAGGPFHFGTRVNGRYVDPTDLFGVRIITVALIPHDDGLVIARFLDLAERSERLHLLERWQGGGGLWDRIRAAADLIAGFGSSPWGLLDPSARLDELLHLAEVLGTLVVETNPQRLVADLVVGLWDALHPPPCTPVGADLSTVPGRRIAVVVDGLDSSSIDPGAMDALDLTSHGYRTTDIVRFSYSGGIVPPSVDGWAMSVHSSHYGSAATRGDVREAIPRLAQTLEAIAAANPGVTIDVYGHSLGGLLVRHALNALDPSVVPVDVAVTIAAPHQGTASAEFMEVLELTTPGTFAAGLLEVGWPNHLLVAPVVEDLSKSGFAGDTSALPFPEDVHAVTIGARADVVVPATDSWAPGASHVVVGGSSPIGAHTGLPGWPEVGREIDLAMSHLPPACESTLDRMLDAVVPRAIEYAEHGAAGLAVVADVTPG